MSDLLVAAEGAGASLGDLRSIAERHSSAADNGEDLAKEAEDFCAVDDLEVAAAAAISFQANATSSSEEESSSDESSSSESSSDEESSSSDDDDSDGDVINMIDDDDDSDDVGEGMRKKVSSKERVEEFVEVELLVDDEDVAKVKLHLTKRITKERQRDVMEIDMSDEDNNGDDGVEGKEAVKGATATNREELMKEMNDLMEKIPDESPAKNDFILPKLNKIETNITISATDKLDLAGAISSVVEGMIVVKAKLMSRPLEIGSLVALECRTPLGRVQEIFGPVESPFYILQLLRDDLSDRVKLNAQVYSVEKHSHYIIPLMLKQVQPGRLDKDAADDDDDLDEDDDDVVDPIRIEAQEDVPPLVGGHAFLEERRKRRVKRSAGGTSGPTRKFQSTKAQHHHSEKSMHNSWGGQRGPIDRHQGNGHTNPLSNQGPPPQQFHPQQFGFQGSHCQNISGNHNGPAPGWGPSPNQWCPPPNHPSHSRPDFGFNQASYQSCAGAHPPPNPNFQPNPYQWGGPPPSNAWTTPPAPSFLRAMSGPNPPPPSQPGSCGPNGGGPFQFGMQGQIPQGNQFATHPPGSQFNGGVFPKPAQGSWGESGRGMCPPQANPETSWQSGVGSNWGSFNQQARPNFGLRPFRGRGGVNKRGRGGWSGFGPSAPPGLE